MDLNLDIHEEDLSLVLQTALPRNTMSLTCFICTSHIEIPVTVTSAGSGLIWLYASTWLDVCQAFQHAASDCDV